jgi:hypothetical protein
MVLEWLPIRKILHLIAEVLVGILVVGGIVVRLPSSYSTTVGLLVVG